MNSLDVVTLYVNPQTAHIEHQALQNTGYKYNTTIAALFLHLFSKRHLNIHLVAKSMVDLVDWNVFWRALILLAHSHGLFFLLDVFKSFKIT